MDESDIDQKVQKHFQRIGDYATKLVEPFVIGIYAPRAEPKRGVGQVGTGFLVRHQKGTILVTAKHVLYGHYYDENPGDKLIIAAGGLTPLGDIGIGEVCKADDHDLACMILNELADAPAVEPAQIAGGDHQAREVTIYGYRANGLKIDRPNGALRPEPRCYTSLPKDHGDGYVGLRIPKSQFRNTASGMTVMAARPEGLSGGPMLDGDALADGAVRIVGVFTDYKQGRGYGFGESADKVRAMLSWLDAQRPID